MDVRQSWRTEPAFFAWLNRVFHFTVDACASRENALLPRFWTERDDAFVQSWERERVYCNPPFCLVKRAMEKARTGGPRLAVVVMPCTSITTGYFYEHHPPHLWLPKKKLEYLPPLEMKVPSGCHINSPIGTVVALWGATNTQLGKLGSRGSVFARPT